MMNEGRLKLHEELCELLGSRNVYFQPPESLSLKYPAIVYSRSNISNMRADNTIYDQHFKYKVTVLDKSPDSIIVAKMSKLDYAVFDRHFTANGYNHDQFTITYKK